MKLRRLFLKNFRNYKEAEVALSDKVNLFTGENGQGKTNLLEAIALLSTGRSMRSAHLSDLIAHGESFFFLSAEIERDGVAQTLSIHFDGKLKRVEYNATHLHSYNHLLGLLPIVLYAPGDTDLIVGSPAGRRRFLNLPLSQSDPLYVHHLTRFTRAMTERNALLKKRSTEAIECFEEEMARSGSYLIQKREEFLSALTPHLEVNCHRISSGKEKLSLRYFPSAPKEKYRELLEKNRSRDLAYGATLLGPHRDDVAILLNEKPARLFASEGQKKTIVASLRLSEWEQLYRALEQPPLFGIDDLGLHFDPFRQKSLEDHIHSFGQVFITTPQPLTIEGAMHHRIENGLLSLR